MQIQIANDLLLPTIFAVMVVVLMAVATALRLYSHRNPSGGLNAVGTITIVAIVIAALLGVTKFILDHLEKSQEKTKQRAQYSDLKEQIARALQPLREASIRYTVLIKPTYSLEQFKLYKERRDKALPLILFTLSNMDSVPGVMALRTDKPNHVVEIIFDDTSDLFPKKNEVFPYNTFANSLVEVSIYKKPLTDIELQKLADGATSQSADLVLSSMMPAKRCSVHYEILVASHFLTCIRDLGLSHISGQVLAVTDLYGAQVVAKAYEAPISFAVHDFDVQREIPSPSLISFDIRFPNHRPLEVGQKQSPFRRFQSSNAGDSSTIYVYQIGEKF